MGLDMWLVRKHYIWSEDRKLLKITSKKSIIKPERVRYIEEEIGYWRKANAIHKWFVENVQNFEDDCKEYYVELEQLKTLLSLCKKVIKASVLIKGKIKNGQEYKDGEWTDILIDGKYIKDPTVAKDLLPTREGFFFGSTDYNEYYLEDIKDTVKIIENILKEEKETKEANKNAGDYYYNSSW